MIQKDHMLVRDNFKVIDGKKKLNHEILLQTFKEFCNNNIVEEKHQFNRNALAIGMCYLASHNHCIWNIRVYETLGLDREKLLKEDGVAEKDLNFYDEKLKAYGLSLNERLSLEEIKELQREDSDYDRKKMLMK